MITTNSGRDPHYGSCRQSVVLLLSDGQPTPGVPGIVNTVHGLYATPDDPLLRRSVVYGLERVAAATPPRR